MKMRILSLILVAFLSSMAMALDTVLDVNQVVYDSTMQTNVNNGEAEGQTFTIGEGFYFFKEIWVANLYYGYNQYPATITAELREGTESDGNPNTLPLLASVTRHLTAGPVDPCNPSQVLPHPDESIVAPHQSVAGWYADAYWYSFVFPDVPVIPGNEYTILFTASQGGIAISIKKFNLYDGGDYLHSFDWGASWDYYPPDGAYDGLDLTFKTFCAHELGYENKAKTPTPADFSTVTKTEGANLSWEAGLGAVTHKVYWSDDQDAVINRTGTPEVLIRAIDGNSTTTPSSPQLGITYYWAVDEVNSLSVTADGRTWRYTIQDYFYVDDFESYDGSTSSGNDVWAVWDDGYFGSSGSGVHSVYDGADGTVKAMEYLYSNNGTSPYGGSGFPYYSEIVANTSDPCLSCGSDWTADGVAFLQVSFKGQAGNDANERMYVVIEDSVPNFAMVQYGIPTGYNNPSWPEDMNNIKLNTWKTWGIDLRTFAGVALDDVQKIYIGFGERGNTTTPGGTGTVIFDEIKIRIPGLHDTPDNFDEDLNDDGVIDFKDLSVLTNKYLAIEDDGMWPQL